MRATKVLRLLTGAKGAEPKKADHEGPGRSEKTKKHRRAAVQAYEEKNL